MRIAIIDADLIGRKTHRFPNLVCMKLSAFYKRIADHVELKTDYWCLDSYDKVFISKVFTDTPVPLLDSKNVIKGGTGFFFENAEPLPAEIEHIKPDYHLYDKWINPQLKTRKRLEFKEYLDYSIGFLTRGCFRKCPFCVNQKYDHVFKASQLEEFYDSDRKKICLLDDNFMGYSGWREELDRLAALKKKFKFKQGLDARLMTEEKCEKLFSLSYDDDITFAFDNIADAEIIEKKIRLMRRFKDRQFVFYVFCGFDRDGIYDKEFWQRDIENVFKRIEILGRYGCLPYIMRHKNYLKSPYKGIYITLAAWCNQFSFFKKKTFCEYSEIQSKSAMRYAELFEGEIKPVFDKYANRKLYEKGVRLT